MEMHQVRYFVALCEMLNFTKAADACNVAQPTLTKAIQKLEDELGGPLFSRERGLTHLTDLGRLMRPHLESVYESSQAARMEAQSFRKMEIGNVRLGAMCTIGPSRLVSFLKRFRREVPSVALTIEDAPGGQLVSRLMEGELDAAILGLPELPERAEIQPLYTEKYVVAFAAGHPFEAKDVVPLRDLDKVEYLTRIHCEYPHYLESLGLPDPAEVRVCYESEREDWIQAMVLAGLGCTVMPEYMPIMPGILCRPLTEPDIFRQVSLVTVAGRRYSPAMRAFVSLARRHDWTLGAQ